MSESLKQFHEDRVHRVDIVPGSADTSPSLQKTQLPDWDKVADHPFKRKDVGIKENL
ncbi:hypothetical protein Taro_050344, partial [Colocasia esculenta]|nr:hypothetical protein [Colocasia esculenta]